MRMEVPRALLLCAALSASPALSANESVQVWLTTASGNKLRGRCVDVAGPSTADVSTADGELLHQWSWVGGANQQLRPVSTGTGWYRFEAAPQRQGAGRAVTARGSSSGSAPAP